MLQLAKMLEFTAFMLPERSAGVHIFRFFRIEGRAGSTEVSPVESVFMLGTNAGGVYHTC